jgi:uncharacterized protein with von Willebrand factor type A (vWA) domain
VQLHFESCWQEWRIRDSLYWQKCLYRTTKEVYYNNKKHFVTKFSLFNLLILIICFSRKQKFDS